jgi:hypothetical protein
VASDGESVGVRGDTIAVAIHCGYARGPRQMPKDRTKAQLLACPARAQC